MSDDLVESSEQEMVEHFSRLGNIMWKIHSYKTTASIMYALYSEEFGELGIADEIDADAFMKDILVGEDNNQ
jgi:hypothetical protein